MKSPESASLIRRIAAIFYDLLLLIGILFVVSAIAVWINRGEAVEHPLYYLALLIATYVFYGWFWTHGGQTLGLRTWRLRVVDNHGDTLNWRQSLHRFAAAWIAFLPAAAGLLWIIFDRDSLALHDRLSKTRIIVLPKGYHLRDNSEN
ncbi:MAG: RDD family protein [Pseudomonadota bacterium]